MNVMRRAWADLRARRNLDTYVATVIAIVFAALGIVGDVVPESLKWSALFAGLGILLFRITLPPRPATPAEQLLADREAFADVPFRTLIANAEQLCVFAPSAINVLNPEHCQAIRNSILSKGNGAVRVAVLDPANSVAKDLAVRQLDENLQYPTQDFPTSLSTSVAQLAKMASWNTVGSFSYAFAGYNPGFSLVVIDPARRDGRVIVEFHGFSNESTSSRMHVTLTRQDSQQWYDYWIHQFEEIWRTSRKQAP